MPSRTTTPPAPATTGLCWEVPPTGRAAKTEPDKYQAEAAELRARPGDWAVLAMVGTTSQAYRLKKAVTEAKYPAFAPAGAFEATSSTNGDGIKVYVRFKAPEAEAPQA